MASVLSLILSLIKQRAPPTVRSIHLLCLMTPQQPRNPMRSSTDPSAISRKATFTNWVTSSGTFSIFFIKLKMEPLSTFTQIPTPRMAAPANYRRGSTKPKEERAHIELYELRVRRKCIWNKSKLNTYKNDAIKKEHHGVEESILSHFSFYCLWRTWVKWK